MSRCYVIAEIGINHNGSLDLAKRLIDAAKDAGASAVKFQKRTIEKVYTKEELDKPRESPFGTTNRALKQALEFSHDAYRELFAYATAKDMDCSASCWDEESVAFVSSLRPPWLKIPSALITDMALLDAYAGVGVPLIVSTGMSTWEEIDSAVLHLHGWHHDDVPEFMPPLTLLHCHSSYPSPLEEVNLACINSFKERYPGVKVGYSSHTVSPWPCLMAVVYGAEVVEFHLTLDRASFGSDQAASLEPAAAKKLIEEIRTFEKCKGDGVKRVYPSEEPIKAKLRKQA